MQRSSLLRVHRRVWVVLGGLVVEAGCLWIWHVSPSLTSIYNAEYTREFFAVFPWLTALADSEPFSDAASATAWLVAGLLLMTAGYLLALLGWRNGLATWLVIGFAAAFRVTVAALPGLFSTDVFSYVMYGRIAAVHAQNPYLAPPSAFVDDPFLGWVFAFWRDQPSVYGPLWTDLSQALSWLTADWPPFAQVQAYRATIIGFEALGLVALWWLLGRLQPGERPRLWLLYAWNPLVVFDLVGATHNDAVMLTLLLFGLALLLARRRVGAVAGFGLVALSALVKFTTALVVPLTAVAWARQSRDPSHVVLRLGMSLGLPLALAIGFWWPWFASAAPLLDAAGGRLSINSAPDVLALSFADPELARFWTRSIARGVFAVWFAWEMVCLWRTHASMQSAIAASARLLLGLPLLVLSWVWSWYFSWALVLAVLAGSRSRLLRLVVAYTLVVLPVVYAHQYLNEEFAPGWVLGMALAPLSVVLPIRRAGVARKLFETGGNKAMNLRTLPMPWGITIVRVMAGLIITVAAFEKFNGGGFDAFTRTSANLGLPLPGFWGVFIPLLELIGGLMVLLGLGARWAACLFIVEYFVTGFVLKIPRQPPFGGWDSMRIDLMLWAAVLAIAAVGPGAFALESLVLRRGRADLPMAGRAVPG